MMKNGYVVLLAVAQKSEYAVFQPVHPPLNWKPVVMVTA